MTESREKSYMLIPLKDWSPRLHYCFPTKNLGKSTCIRHSHTRCPLSLTCSSPIAKVHLRVRVHCCMGKFHGHIASGSRFSLLKFHHYHSEHYPSIGALGRNCSDCAERLGQCSYHYTLGVRTDRIVLKIYPYSGVLLQFAQVQFRQNCPAAKHTQYSFKHLDFLQLHFCLQNKSIPWAEENGSISRLRLQIRKVAETIYQDSAEAQQMQWADLHDTRS